MYWILAVEFLLFQIFGMNFYFLSYIHNSLNDMSGHLAVILFSVVKKSFWNMILA